VYVRSCGGTRKLGRDKCGKQPEDFYTFLCESGNDNHNLWTWLFVHAGIISGVRRVDFVSDRMSQTELRRRWCDIFLNVHASTGDKSDDMKESFYEDLRCAFDKFHTCYKNISWGYFNAKVGRVDILKPNKSGMRAYMKSKMIMELTYYQANSMEDSPSWEANNHSVKKFSAFYRTWRFSTMFTKAYHWSLSQAKLIQSTPLSPIFP